MDYGTIMDKLLTGQYEDADQLLADAEAVARNCETYWASRGEPGRVYMQDARLLLATARAALTADKRRVERKMGTMLAFAEQKPDYVGGGGGGIQQSEGAILEASSSSFYPSSSSSSSSSSAAASTNYLAVPSLVIPPPLTSSESEAALSRRAVKFFRDCFSKCLDDLLKHYLVSPLTGAKVVTSLPFQQKVR